MLESWIRDRIFQLGEQQLLIGIELLTPAELQSVEDQ